MNESTVIDANPPEIKIGSFIKFPSIERFSDVVHRVDKFGVKDLFYLSKIKLHGTNAGIHILSDGTIRAQKRTSILNKEDNDNAGFRAWTETLKVRPGYNKDLLLFGEWAGMGIQKEDAVCEIDNKYFFIFMAIADGEWIVSPQLIQGILYAWPAPFDQTTDSLDRIRVLPVFSASKVDFTNEKLTQDFFNHQKEAVEEIGKRDPYIAREFNVMGAGEGLVYYPVYKDKEDSPLNWSLYQYWRDYTWKLKTSKHSETAKKQKVRPEKPAGVDEFLNNFITETRMQKILDEQFEGRASRKDTGNFLKAVMVDVHKESKTEIELAEFEWKDATKFAPSIIKRWWFEKTG